jgi:hypothetical protein
MKKIALFLIALLIGIGLIPYASPSAFAKEDQQQIVTDQIKLVNMKHADLIYVPLYGDRKEDSSKIKSLAKLLNEVLSKGEVYPNYEQLPFFDTSISLGMRDGTSFYFKIDGGIVFFRDGVPYKYVNAALSNEIQSYMVDLPTQNIFDKFVYRIGETVRRVGNDAGLEKGLMMVALTPISQKGGYSSDDPSYQLMFTSPITFGRYDFDIPIPAFAIDPKGQWVPVVPGKYSLSNQTGWSIGGQLVDIKAPSRPTLSINGQLFTALKYQPILSKGQILIPLRAVAEELGWKVGWNVATDAVTLNNKPLAATDTHNIKGKTYIPLRSAAKVFGLDIDWEPATKSAHLIVNPKLLDIDSYAEDSNEKPIATLFNNYLNLFNQRDNKGLFEVSGEHLEHNPAYSEIGYRYISSADGLKLETNPDGSILASVIFTYLFDARGIRSENKSFLFRYDEDRWTMSPASAL